MTPGSASSAARAHRRADRRRDLDRIGHPRLPRAEGRVDEEPGGREAVDDPALSRRPRGAQGGVAHPPRLAGVDGRAERAAIARSSTLERRGKLHALVTQNIDELHQRAGKSAEHVVEVHGTMRRVMCWRAAGARRWRTRSRASRPARTTRSAAPAAAS